MSEIPQQVLACAIATRTPVLLWGPPGIGKTATIRSLAETMGLPLEIVIAAIHEPADFSGLPYPDGDRVRYLTPDWAVRLAEAGHGVLFLDEISTAPPAVQAALLRIVLERRVGQLQLPDDVVVIAAANPPEEAAAGWELAAPLANRFCHIDWPVPGTQEWTTGITVGWTPLLLPSALGEWQRYLPSARGLVAGFLSSAPHHLFALPEDLAQRGRAWPSPRTWEMATRMLAAVLALSPSEELVATAVGACVGRGIGYELAALVSGDRLLDPFAALADPEGNPLPERPDKLITLLMAIAAVASEDVDRYWTAAWTVIARVAGKRRDIAAVAARPLARVYHTELGRGRLLPMPPEAVEPLKELLEAAGMITGGRR
jgi:hypothetical protein